MKKSAFELSKLVQECVEALRGRSRKKSLSITVSIPDDLPRIHGDETKVHSVITNVLTNADKFTPDPAKIKIRARVNAKDRCIVQVTDNGIGPPQGQAGEVIQFFHHDEGDRVKKYGGLGIGLVLAREILTAHGGKIRMEARKGHPGSIVTFDLPLAGRGKARGKGRKKGKARKR